MRERTATLWGLGLGAAAGCIQSGSWLTAQTLAGAVIGLVVAVVLHDWYTP